MSDLWAPQRESRLASVQPLAARMRPRTLAEFAGQRHIVGEEGDSNPSLLRRMIRAGRLTSIILHGPPGTGKTTLAEIIAAESGRPFVRENAASIGVKRIREIVDESKLRIGEGGDPLVLFLDEIHRFTRSQQDSLLDDVERGRLTLIGATTENPMFTVNAALVSRSTVFRLEPLTQDEVASVLRRAIQDPERGFGTIDLTVDDEAILHWAKVSDGDARRALNALEVAVLSAQAETDDQSPLHIDLDAAQASVQQKAVLYDAKGDQHYDHASALIKSIRGSDPDAAVYWLGLMLEAGEDPRFIARRLAILASEDIGNADPRAISVADSCWSIAERIGMPESRITLSQCAIYLALAPKSNASYLAINQAMADIRSGRTLKVPLYLRDAHKAESVGSQVEGKGYHYSHDAPHRTSIGPVSAQRFLIDEHGHTPEYYQPTTNGSERVLAERLEEVRAVRDRNGDTQEKEPNP
ncbi:MAG: replication-associated recombination protein A [Phycisphaerales bacterium JB065]